jgi:hypothetical protein
MPIASDCAVKKNSVTKPGKDIRGNFFSRLKEQIEQGNPQHLDLMEKVMDSFHTFSEL